MPELPDLEVVAEILAPRIAGRTVRGVELRRPDLLQTGEASLRALAGAELGPVSRRGKFLRVSFDSGLHLVVDLGRWAWLWHGPGVYPPSTDTDLRLLLADGTEVRLIESKVPRLAAVWVPRDPLAEPPLVGLGPEPLDPGFTPEALKRALAGRRRTLKRLLTDQRVVAGVGDAYADEILFQARLSPFRFAHTLSGEEVERLWRAIGETLRWAIGEIRSRAGGKLMDREIRDFLPVHGKRGAPCPVCGAPVAEVQFDEVRTNYCPACQR